MALEITLRNKNIQPIVTLQPAVLKAFLAARPESYSLVLQKHRADYRTLTGKVVTLDYEQNQLLSVRAGANSQGHWTSKYAEVTGNLFHVTRMFSTGFLSRTISDSLLSDLAIAEAFYTLLDTQLLPELSDGKAG